MCICTFIENYLINFAISENVDKLVIKPLIGATGYDTFIVEKDEILENVSKIKDVVDRRGGLLIQEFVPEIKDEGEFSYIYLNGNFSHAVR